MKEPDYSPYQNHKKINMNEYKNDSEKRTDEEIRAQKNDSEMKPGDTNPAEKQKEVNTKY